MSSFILKIIAIITMFCDHFGDIFIGHLSAFNIIGRIAFPIFAFQIAVGYKHTKNIKKYALRLIIFALISQIPFSIFKYIMGNSVFDLNVCFTLLLGLLTLLIFEKVDDKFFKYLYIFIILLIAHFANVDYGAWGVFLIFFIYLFCPKVSNLPMKRIIKLIIFIAGFLLLCILEYISYLGSLPTMFLMAVILFSFLPSIFMLLYNGKKGYSLKYLFYLFYPVHLIVLEIVYYLIKNGII